VPGEPAVAARRFRRSARPGPHCPHHSPGGGTTVKEAPGFYHHQGPFAGVITGRYVEPGDYVTKNSHLLTLADPASLVAEVHASKLILPRLEPGDPRWSYASAPWAPTASRTRSCGSIRPWPGPVARPPSRWLWTLSLRAPGRPFRPRDPGYRRHLPTLGTLLRRAPCAVRRAPGPGAPVVAERWEQGPVRTGLCITDRIEIPKGLEPGKRVVTRGFPGLTEDKVVQVVADSP